MKILTPNARYIFDARSPKQDPSKWGDLDVRAVREIWVENVYQIHPDDFSVTGIFVDIGANIGAASLFVSSFQDDRSNDIIPIRVIAYEPEPHNLMYLKKNVKQNGKESAIQIIEKGLWSENSRATISNHGGNSKISHVDNKHTGAEIELITLADVFEQNDIQECDVLKIDIEGAEAAVINASSIDTLKRIRYLCLEFEGRKPGVFGEMVEKLSEVFNLHVIGRPSGGGYIYGRRY